MGADILSLRVVRLGGFDDATVADDVLKLSPFVLKVLDVPLEVEKPRVAGDAEACAVCGRWTGCCQPLLLFCGSDTCSPCDVSPLNGCWRVTVSSLVAAGLIAKGDVGSKGTGGDTAEIGRPIVGPAVDGR